MADLVPFGKYKNQPLEVLANDPEYCAWLVSQGWVAERYPQVHTIIINNFAEPSETPEHNALQLRFLEEPLRLKVSMCIALFRESINHDVHRTAYTPFFAEVTSPLFEQSGIDVQWTTRCWYPCSRRDYPSAPLKYFWDTFNIAIAVECKPTLGDDYPAVLRFLHSLKQFRDKVVIAEQFAFRGGTVQQVQALFQSSGVLLLDMPGLEALPPVACIAEADLPPAQDYLSP